MKSDRNDHFFYIYVYDRIEQLKEYAHIIKDTQYALKTYFLPV